MASLLSLRRALAASAVAALMLAAGTAPGASGETSPVPFDPPVADFSMTRAASLPTAPWHAGHRGIDVTAAPGTQVLAPAAGTLTFAGWVVDRPVVVVTHAGGFVTSLEPVEASLTVGTPVERGAPVGVVTNDAMHCASEPCLHWGLRRDGDYVDPLDYLTGFGPIQLLPVG